MLHVVPALLMLAAPAADKPAGKPTVFLRAAPRVAVAPARIVFTVELKGGADDESLDCLTLKFDWGDGGSSESAGDCGQTEDGRLKVQRLFSADHQYGNQAQPVAQVTVLKGERVVGRDSASLKIGPRPTRLKVDIQQTPR